MGSRAWGGGSKQPATSVDAGTWLLAPPVDLELTVRGGEAPDIGAYELAGAR